MAKKKVSKKAAKKTSKKLAKKAVKKRTGKTAAKKVLKKTTPKPAKKATRQNSKSSVLVKKNSTSRFMPDDPALQINKQVFDKLHGKKLFEKICNVLHDQIGYHVLNLFVFSTDPELQAISIQGIAHEKPVSWGGISPEPEQKKQLLKYFSKQKTEPEVTSFPVELLFTRDSKEILPLHKSIEWADARQSRAIVIPISNANKENVGLLVFALIDSPTSYTRGDLDEAINCSRFLQYEILANHSDLLKKEFEIKAASIKSHYDKAIKEIKSDFSSSKNEVKSTRQKLTDLQISFEGDLKKQKAELLKKQKEEFSELKSEIEIQKSNLQEKQKDFDAQVSALKEEFGLDKKNEIKKIKIIHKQNVVELEETLNKKNEQFNNLQIELQTMQKNHQDLVTKNKNRLSDLQEDRNRLIASFETEKKELIDSHEKIITQKEELLKNTINKYRAEKEEIIDKNKNELNIQIENHKIALDEELEKQKKYFEELLDSGETKLEEIIQNHTGKVAALQQQIDSDATKHRNLLESFEEETKEKSRLIEQNKINTANIEKLQLTISENSLEIENARASIIALEAQKSKDESIIEKLESSNESKDRQFLQLKQEFENTSKQYQDNISDLKQSILDHKQEISKNENDLLQLNNTILQCNTKIEFLEKELDQKAGLLEKENIELKARIIQAEQARRQAENDYHEKKYQIDQKLQILTESSNRKLENAQTALKEIAQQLELTTEQKESIENDLKNQLSKSDLAVQNGLDKIISLESKCLELETENKNLENIKSDLTKKLEENSSILSKMKAELDDIVLKHKDEVESIKKDHINEIRIFKEGHEKLEATINHINNEKQQLQANLDKEIILVKKHLEQIKKFELSILETEEKLRQLESSNSKKENRISDLLRELDITQDKIKKSQINISELKTQIKEQNARLGISAERHAQLEKNIIDSNHKIDQINTRLSNANEKSRDLQQTIEARDESINELKNEILMFIQNEKQFKKIIKDKESRIDNFTKEGRVLADMVKALGDLENLQAKLEFLRNHFITDNSLDRIVVYQVADNDQLVFKYGIWAQMNFELANDFVIALNKTAFAQVIATLNPGVVKREKNLIDIDLPKEIKDHIVKQESQYSEKFEKSHFEEHLIVPLCINHNVNGIMILSSESKNIFTNTSIELAENVSSLFSIALEYEKIKILMNNSNTIHSTLHNVLDYKRSRYIRMNNLYHSMIADSNAILKKVLNEEELKADNHENVLKLVAAPRLTPELRESDLINVKTGLMQWIDQLGNLAVKSIKLEYKNQVSEVMLEKFLDVLKDKSCHMFWFVLECFENIIKHSQASRAIVLTQETSRGIKFSIVDNGEGLVRTSGSQNPENGSGLFAMKNLALLMNCNIEFARDDKGFGLSISLIQKS